MRYKRHPSYLAISTRKVGLRTFIFLSLMIFLASCAIHFPKASRSENQGYPAKKAPTKVIVATLLMERIYGTLDYKRKCLQLIRADNSQITLVWTSNFRVTVQPERNEVEISPPDGTQLQFLLRQNSLTVGGGFISSPGKGQYTNIMDQSIDIKNCLPPYFLVTDIEIQR